MQLHKVLGYIFTALLFISSAAAEVPRSDFEIDSRATPVSISINIQGSGSVIGSLNGDRLIKADVSEGGGGTAARISDWLVRGQNSLSFSLIKPLGYSSKSGSRASTLKIVVSVGSQKLEKEWSSTSVSPAPRSGALWQVNMEMAKEAPPFAFESAAEHTLDTQTKERLSADVIRLWNAFQAKDTEQVVDLSTTRIMDLSPTQPGTEVSASKNKLSALLSRIFTQPNLTLSPLSSEQIRFEAYARGKVWKAIREDGSSVISFGSGGGMDVYLADIGGTWVWIR